MLYTLGQIAKTLNAKIIGNPNSIINFLLYDSRRIVPSSNSLFFALTSSRDGHNFIPEIFAKGVKNFVVSKYSSSFPDANYIIVENTLRALQKLAKFHRSKFKIPVIAVTGSNGKTIVKDWLAHFLSQKFITLRSPKSFNSQIGVPLSVWELSDDHQIAVFEAGISKPGEMQRLEEIIMPTIGVFTILGDAHQENFSSLEEKLVEKLRLFDRCEKIFFCADQPLVRHKIFDLFSDKNLICWAKSFDKCQLTIADVQSTGDGTKILGEYLGQSVSIQISFFDQASVHNAITVWLVLLDMFGIDQVKDFDFRTLPQIEMRLQQLRGMNNTIIINDSYNCDLTSFSIALDFLVQQASDKPKTVILSDIEQVIVPNGNNNARLSEEKVYQAAAQLVRNASIERFIGVGTRISRYGYLFNNATFFDTTDQLLKNLSSLRFLNEVILLKGARRFRFERISRALQQKSHRTVFEINLNALKHNLNYFRSYLAPKTRLMVMVKAFSYGSGYEIVSLLQAEKVDYLGVAIADEGVELREAGIKLPIIVMNPDSDNFDLFPEYSLEPEIYSFRILQKFYESVRDKVHYPMPIHIKINTGMNRLGFDLDQIDRLITILHQMKGILKVRSVFSHLAASPDPDFDNFTLRQINIFRGVAQRFKQEFGSEVIAHILNSAGIERFSFAQMDMVRLGIGLYGISAVESKRLKHIGTLKTRISQLRRVRAGQSIGYSRSQFVKRDSIIGIIPIGYADGLNRRLSKGKGKVCVRGKLVPIVGNINMDMTMIDVTDVTDVREGDEVIIFGKCPTIEQVAQWLDTIPYEILTSISSRVKRVYVYE